ncbi:MFS transporter [Nocardia tengchongensis]|uniref:MFS transporter n=1 Tax=Nocardia tengchongensis TaxID=2055889 RepID=UPI00367C7E76
MPKSTIFDNRDFLFLWSGNAASNIGLSGVRIAYPLLALILTGSPMSASVVSFAIILPSLIFEIPAGMASDYWDRRRVLVKCQQLGLAATLIAALVVITRPPGLSVFLAGAAFVEGAAYVFFSNSELGLVRDIVAVNERSSAIAFLEAEQSIAQLAGRALGVMTLGIARSLPFLANTASYLYCLWTLSRMGARMPDKPEVDGPAPATIWDWNHVGSGVRTIWAEPLVKGATIILGITNAIFQVFILLMTVQVRNSGHPVWVIGIVLGATGLGGLLGAVLAAGLANRFSPRIMFTCTLWAWVVLCIPMAMSSNPLVLAMCWMGIGFAAPPANVALTLYRLRVFPENYVGRIHGAIKLIANGGAAFGSLLAGTLLSVLGISETGWILVTLMVLMARIGRRLPEPRPAAPGLPTNWITRLSLKGPGHPEVW